MNTATLLCDDVYRQSKKARKIFSHSQRIIIASAQNYLCPGEVCQGNKQLPSTWELDHKIPLFMGGDNTLQNLWILRPNCHARKTQKERVDDAFGKRANNPVEFDNVFNQLESIKTHLSRLHNIEKYTPYIDFPVYFDFSSNRYVVKYTVKNVVKRKSFGCRKYKSKQAAKSVAKQWFATRILQSKK
jgi:hypothetical protein